ncbi:alpha/beta hydrolase fold domain-containing protein [Microbispora sp. CA-102843]|uniref:alpha/beta hydrolase fold domain-containing protein n=1 Tax=Microbispora sp. CA-102843 TaxID=3239952 RepID=UPI003D939F59
MRLPPPAHDAPLPPARPGAYGTRVLPGVPYAAIPGVRPLELDLVLPPETEGPVPCVVFLHGGGWRAGSRRSMGPAFEGAAPTPFELVAWAGVAVAGADYRLSGEALWPAQLHDVKAAVRWLRARGGELGIDIGRIAAWGESAGGHLAALLGLTPGDPTLEGGVGVTGPSSAVAAVAAWYAPSDLRTVAAGIGADPADPASREALLLGAPVPSVPDAAALASPVTHVSPGAPPFLLLHGRSDRMIACAQSERLRDELRAAGAEVDLHVYDGADHMWLGAPEAARETARETARDALDRTIAFLRERLHI